MKLIIHPTLHFTLDTKVGRRC